jgi:esterase/lipase superfamily enzyme
MAPTYWMITNRSVTNGGTDLGDSRASNTYWTTDQPGVDDLTQWTRRTAAQFRKELIAAAGEFPQFGDPADNQSQRHIALFIHGYNNTWRFAANRYKVLADTLLGGAGKLGICVLYSWPSDGMPTNYLPDRIDAERSAPDLADVLADLYDEQVAMQTLSAEDSSAGCRAKISIIAHSMGNYLLQRAMQHAWTRKNRPLLLSLVNQMVMVAADVDNNLFGSGEEISNNDGDAIANLTYRVTALYTGRDPVLGLSAGMKHFGKRRLGRSGLDRNYPTPDNVWDVDCSDLFAPGQGDIHGAYFVEPKTIDLMRSVLRGIDRGELRKSGEAPARSAPGAISDAGVGGPA